LKRNGLFLSNGPAAVRRADRCPTVERER
jgi:hypothetical protein